MTETTGGRPSLEQLDALTTDELKERAFGVARERGDVGFVWELVKHLPQAREFAGEDGATTGMVTTINDVLALFEEVFGHQVANVGETEPLLRARFIDYLMEHERA